ncbi:gluconate 2-dehydrogenase subunit 3 family protein [Shewanella rhizosphaerae]|uniref:gluconate 2-dehydrogenase subunit 3 family protein n=1 Tax=Shewanella rhizosphaerae TaxID=2864207 RepID=UPI001C65BD62|nr:gluconate 2-dehydrogenase subunit 3 family protein [Shewanella rhizosphaerae]QYK12129.1 gluconate 2-dehydrogenase subunit 3 family protein [Shewanella rhizosphaerae]
MSWAIKQTDLVSKREIKLARSKREATRQYAFESGLTRRDFLVRSGALGLLLAAKPELSLAGDEGFSLTTRPKDFDVINRAVIESVQLHLFPDDGDGPSAKELNAYRYLLWAIEDPDNRADEDRQFILQGAAWLEDWADTQTGRSFLVLSWDEQEALLTAIAKSRAGENWLSLLLYYLIEALMLDPLYGGNPDEIGWRWLEHQPGFPRPVTGKSYLDF